MPVLIFLFWLLAILVLPLVTLAALNGLGLAVPYTAVAYFSALWFHIVFAGSASASKK